MLLNQLRTQATRRGRSSHACGPSSLHEVNDACALHMTSHVADRPSDYPEFCLLGRTVRLVAVQYFLPSEAASVGMTDGQPE